MTVRSMTGFARVEGMAGSARWTFEVRSVNGRGLDLRFRLPPGQDALESRAREAAQRRLSRGSITIALDLARVATPTAIRLDEAALAQVIVAADRVRALTGAGPPTVEGLLAIRGVLVTVDTAETPEQEMVRLTALLAGFDQALDGLIAAREQEGARIAAVLSALVDTVAAELAVVTDAPGRRPEVIARRLADQVARLVAAGAGAPGLDRIRLHQEAVMLATKADIAEEVQRLTMHVAAVRAALAAEGPIGRQLEFLVQELLREANTLCAKAADAELSRAGLAMKVAIDQMREQVANIE